MTAGDRSTRCATGRVGCAVGDRGHHRSVSGAGGLVALLPGHRHTDRDAAARRAARCAAVSDGAGADGVSGAGARGALQRGTSSPGADHEDGGNTLARRLVLEAAWHYRHRPGVSRTLAQRRSGQPPRVVALADKAQQRLCRRFRRLAEHKPGPVVTVAVARELVGFLWAALHPETA